ncbi:MAG: bifunctional (p)ppGpp synthetase/guanosine-3',5'-bis(diphosphate) 3'-pyrophosphohydrolase [Firmicutes bacterium]|nr:bifunctional (p)ppGpp synthetase/guanosine-3',5'-bis(diphosphate) 3'-pyrophosphohydrolase [Bacillota bacterium]
MLTSSFEKALVYAHRVHAGQKRKGSGIPYITHLLSVAALVLEAGGNETEAIGALLHDAVEDQGGRERLTEIKEEFGPEVAAIVEGCSDALEKPKPEWWERKRRYLAHLPEASPSVLLVSVADKLHNARCIVADYREIGEGLWSRFNTGKEGTLWYYQELTRVYRQSAKLPTALVDELERVVGEMVRQAGNK